MPSRAIYLAFKASLPYFLGISTLYATYHVSWEMGYGEAEERYQLAARIESERQKDINNALREAYRIRELQLLGEMRDRDERIQTLLDEAENDPDADRRSISADSVRRLNSID